MRLFVTILLLLLILFLVALGLALLLGWSLGLGWLLTQFVPALSLFEGGLLVMLATFAVAYLAARIVSALSEIANLSPSEFADEEADDDDAEEEAWEEVFPLEQFQQAGNPLTWEVFFKHRLANWIYTDISTELRSAHLANPGQRQALALRLTDVAFDVLKGHKSISRVSLTLAAMKKEMERAGQRPYDDDILQIAVGATNLLLASDAELAQVARQKRWGELFDGD